MKGKLTSLATLLQNYFSKNKNRDVLFHKRGYRTYKVTGTELESLVNKIRLFLSRMKVNPKDRIILLGGPSIEWIASYYACIISGIVVVPLDTLTDTKLLKSVQDQVKAKAIFQDQGLAEIKIRRVYLNDLQNTLANIKTIPLKPHKTDIDALLEIMYTSGTTGAVKGVKITHRNMLTAIDSLTSGVPLSIRLRILSLVPMSHIFGQVGGLFFSVFYNHKLYLIDTILPRKIISFVKYKKIHAAILVPEILLSLKKELAGRIPLSNFGWRFRLIGVGGASLDEKLEKWWRMRGFLILQGYGLTETTSIVSVSPLLTTKCGSVGVIAPRVKVVLAQDGEILVKGPNITNGYYLNAAKTKTLFTKDEWLKTGDIGEFKNNHLYIKDRKKNIIVLSSGLKVYPQDIENILNQMPEVHASCVIEKDKKVHAAIILKDHQRIAKVVKTANKKLLAHQKIQSWSIWPDTEFPLTPTLKVKKFLVERQISAEQKRSYTHHTRVQRVISTVFETKHKISEKDKLVNIGMDSLNRVELISALEREFAVHLDEELFNQQTQVKDIPKILTSSNNSRRSIWVPHLNIPVLRKIIQKFVVFPLVTSFAKVEYKGLENLKKVKGPVIFAGNHQSGWDSVYVCHPIKKPLAIPADTDVVFGLTTKNNIALKLFRRVRGILAASLFNSYPFGKNIGTERSFELTGRQIDKGKSILIYPEGQRTTDGKIKPFQSGVGLLSQSMKVPIIPFKIEGLYEVLPVHQVIPKFGKVKVTFGEPLFFKDISYLEASKILEKKVKAL